MQNSNSSGRDKSGEKFRYRTHKEHIRLHIVDDNEQSQIPFEDFTDNGKVPMYEGYAPTDPLGSYTGRPADAGEVPVQDVDDL